MMTKAQWEAILACITSAENSDSSYVLRQAETAREWFNTQDWEDE